MTYDAFACYNSHNTQEVARVCDFIRNHHLTVFLDTAALLPGAKHDEVIDAALKESETILVFIGPQGLGPWQKEELLSAHWDGVRNAEKVIIPILLPGAGIEHEAVPCYLRARTAVKFSKTVEEASELLKIIDGILRERVNVNDGKFEKPLTQHEFDSLLNSTITAYDKMAAPFYEKWRDDIPFEKLHALERHLPHGAKILDAGCGPGHHSHYLAGQGFEVTGIDRSKEALSIAKKTQNPKGQPLFLHADMRNVHGFKRHSFDAIWASGSCVHTPDAFLDRQLREFLRLLRPGGYLGITLQASRLPAIEPDGRFFEGYRDESEVLHYLELSHFRFLDVKTDITNKNTHGIANIVQWVAVIAQAPEMRAYVIRSGNLMSSDFAKE